MLTGKVKADLPHHSQMLQAERLHHILESSGVLRAAGYGIVLSVCIRHIMYAVYNMHSLSCLCMCACMCVCVCVLMCVCVRVLACGSVCEKL